MRSHAIWVFLTMSLLASRVLGQASPEPTSEAPTTPQADPGGAFDASHDGSLDLVRLASGAIYRGELLEWVPGSHAVLRLHDGRVQRFAAAEIVEVLPNTGNRPQKPSEVPRVAPAQAPVPTPTAPGAGDQVQVSVQTTRGTTAYAAREGATVPLRLCAEQCELELPRGDYYFGAANGTQPALMASELLRLDSPMRVEIEYESHRTSRIVGGVVLALGTTLGAAFLMRGFRLRADAYEKCDKAAGAAGTDCEPNRLSVIVPAIVLVGVAVASVLLLKKKDTVRTYTSKVK